MDRHLAMTELLAALRLRPVGVRGAGALALAAVGLYGRSVTASRRTREIGIRRSAPMVLGLVVSGVQWPDVTLPTRSIEHPANVVESPVMRDRGLNAILPIA